MKLSSQLGFVNFMLILLITFVGVVLHAYFETALALLGVELAILTEITIDALELRESNEHN